MLNDRKASELISKSLRQPLSDEEAAAVDKHMQDNETSRRFARVSAVIQNSVADLGVLSASGDDSIGPGMSDDQRRRLQKTVSAALRKSLGGTLLHSVSNAQPSTQAAPHDTAGDGSLDDSRLLVSRYTLVRVLGAGGLGKVWLARDEKLKRHVAIKEIEVDTSESDRAWQRFHREAEITGHLEHPNVVPLYQFGTDPKRGQPFYAMRFVGKRTLANAIAEYHDQRDANNEDLGLHRLLTAFLDICQAIAYAHSRGVVHRDLKPENVALDSFGQVIVLDWGLAKLTDEGELQSRLTREGLNDDSTLMKTMDGEVVGTPLYMSPEQASGDLTQIDERTDVYGLGAVLYAILTGRAPHESSCVDSRENLDVRGMLHAIANAETPDPRAERSDVSHRLAEICVRALSRKPYARQSSAAELADQVERWMAGQNRKRERFENLRIEGRELCANVNSSLRDLATSTRFMAILPPIQGIIDAVYSSIDKRPSEDDEPIWRERLTTIFRGLLHSNSDYLAVGYCRVSKDSCQELVRVERSGADNVNVRNVPRSRLADQPICQTDNEIMEQKPEDVLFTCSKAKSAGLPSFAVSASVPVFDRISEDPFGFVVIECDLGRVLRRELLNRVRSATEVIVLDQNDTILMHECRSHGNVNSSMAETLQDARIDDAKTMLERLKTESEFLDESNRETYATRLKVDEQSLQLTFVLTQRDQDAIA